MGWAVALDAVAEPADIWHGMWAGSLPALGRLRRRHGGRTIYDSRDVYLHSRDFDRMHRLADASSRPSSATGPRRRRRLTVNDAYADSSRGRSTSRGRRSCMNCPERWTPPAPRRTGSARRSALPPDDAGRRCTRAT